MDRSQLIAAVGELFDQLQAQATRNTALIKLLRDTNVVSDKALEDYMHKAEEDSALLWLGLREALFREL